MMVFSKTELGCRNLCCRIIVTKNLHGVKKNAEAIKHLVLSKTKYNIASDSL